MDWIFFAAEQARQLSSHQARQALSKSLPWLLTLAGVILLAGILVLVARKFLAGQAVDDRLDGASGMSLDYFRRLRDQGELSSSEYEAIRQELVHKIKAKFDD